MYELKKLRERFVQLITISDSKDLLEQVMAELEGLAVEDITHNNWYVTQLNCMKIDALIKQNSKELDNELEEFCVDLKEKIKVLNQIYATQLAYRAIHQLQKKKHELGIETAKEAMATANSADLLCPIVLEAYQKALEAVQVLESNKNES